MGRKTVGGFNPHRELVRRVDVFLTTEIARQFGMEKRPSFYETAVILFLFEHDKELAEAFEQYGIDSKNIRRIVLERRAILEALALKGAHHEKERSLSHP